MSRWRKLVLFGDSLTQHSFQECGWGAILADALQRKADVLNRGFSGYNTDFAVKIVESVLPPGSLEESDGIVVFFGANDHSLLKLNAHQHVPCDRYASNLQKLLSYIMGLGLPSSRLLIVSPPPVDEKAWEAFLTSEDKGDVSDRRNDVAKLYSDACVKVALENSCAFVNLWEEFMKEDDYKSLLSDGLHFSASGNRLTAQLLLPHVNKLTESWPSRYPDWKQFEL